MSWLTHYHSQAVGPPCKLCSSITSVEKAYNRVFYKCQNCEFIFTTDFTSSVLAKGMGMEGSWSGPGGGGFREYYLAKMLATDLGLSKVLLFGTGNTPTFERLLDEGMDVYGCDISPDVVKHKQARYGTERFFAATEVSCEAQFDVIIAVEVIEHLSEPKESFSMLFSSLSSEGILCGTSDFYQGGGIEDGNTPGYMSLRGHVAYWSVRSMSEISQFYGQSVEAFEMIRPGSVLEDEKYGQLYPNKRVFFIFDPDKYQNYFKSLKQKCPILPIDQP